MARLPKLVTNPTLDFAYSARFRMPHPTRVSFVGWVGSLGLMAILSLAGCRQDMHDQPRFKPLAESDFYADLRSARQPVEGTVARGQLHEDTYFYTGKIGDNPGDYMPSEVPVTAESLAR